MTTLLHRYDVPWSSVEQLPLQLLEVPGRYGTTTTLRIRLVARDLPRDAAWSLMTGTSRGRARSRHNIRVAAGWTRDHGLQQCASLDAALQWAEGDISLQDLEKQAKA